jgi:hypothetical protein
MWRRSLTALFAFILAAAALVGVEGPADAGGRGGGRFPSLSPDFDVCASVGRLIG